jgi:dienelactone hydrolase
MRTWLLLVFGLLISCAAGAAPATDVRNTEIYGFKSHFRMSEYTSRGQWEARRTALRQQILGSAGLFPMPARTPLRPRIVRRLDYADYSIEVVLLETFPGYFLGGNLYLPMVQKASRPAVLIPHGHWKKGRLEDLPSYSVPALGINLARQGYVAFAYDMAGFNDTRQTPHSFANPRRSLWSFHPMGLQLWNSIRALDFLESLPGVDTKRLAVTGASGGASQAIFLTAVDDRIDVTASVNMVSAYMQGGDPCEEAPNLRIGTFNVEIAAMAAPKPMLLVSSTRDWTRNTPEEEFPAIRRIYSLYGQAGMVGSVHIEAEHNYNRQSREAVYRFFNSQLHPDPEAADFEERPYELPPDDQLLAFPKGDLPAEMMTVDQVFQSWRSAARLQMENASTGELRDALRNVLGVEYPATVQSSKEANRIVITRPRRNDRVVGLWRPGAGDPVLVLHPGGAAAAERTELGKQLLNSNRPVLMIDPFTSGYVRSRQFQVDDYFLSYNRTEEAERVQDVLTALAFLKATTKNQPELIGMESAGIRSIFAAAVAPFKVDVVADLVGFSGSDQDFVDRFFVPGIQRAGGLDGAFRLITARVLLPGSGVMRRTGASR